MFKYYSLRNSLYVLCVFFLVNSTNGSIFDYFPIAKSLFTQNENGNSELEIQKVPYEVEVADEKFIEQAAKFTGVSLSDLDRCQHRVVYKLQTECHKLNDEELAKLAVKLLNCQSAIEGRTIYPCTDQMPIRDCTSSMDPDTWNSYLLMSNRARAVCYSIRQAQFRGLTEMTVNKLMGAAHEQLGIMTRLSTSQTQLESATAEALDRVTADTSALREQQRDLQRAQLHGQLTLEDNIRRLGDEKQLIIDGHEQLAKMTKQVQDKLNEASEQLDSQAEERRDNHKEILNDLIEIQKQAQEIFSRIEQSSRQLLTSTELASIQYSSTLSTLSQINATISALSIHMSALNATVSSQLSWLMDGVGGTGLAISSLVQHAAWLLLAMLACSFLQLGPAARLAVLAIPPLNLVCTSYGLSAMNIQGVAGATLACVVAEALLNFALRFRYKKQHLALKQPISSPNIVQDNTPPSSRKGSNDDDDTIEQPQSTYDSPVNSTFSNSFTYTRGNYSNSNTYRRFDVEDSGRESPVEFDFQSPTPPLSRQGRSRSKTPAMNGTERHRCGANTRLGTPCKSLALLGRDYCYRHQTGSSVIVE